VNALVLEQLSKSQGKTTAYITPDAVRIVNQAIGYVIIAKAPAWTVFTINDKKKNYFVSEYSNWKPPAILGVDYCTGGAHWTKVGSERIAGFNVDKCEVEGAKRDKVGNEEIPRSGVYWMANDAAVPARIADLLALYFGVDCLHKLPVRFKAIPVSFDESMDRHPQVMMFLDTLSAHKAPVDTAVFELPKGHKRVVLDADVRMSRKTPKLLNNMLKDLDPIYGRGGRP